MNLYQLKKSQTDREKEVPNERLQRGKDRDSPNSCWFQSVWPAACLSVIIWIANKNTLQVLQISHQQ